MPKQFLFDDEARLKMRDGVAKLARAVRVTMGPTGRNVIIDKSFGKPTVTKDGVTVAKEIELKDPFESMGAKLVNEVATKTNAAVGDGTTTATVFADAIFSAGLRAVTTGTSPAALRRGLERAVKAAVEAIQAQSRPVAGRSDVRKVAFISSREEAVADAVAEAFDKVGKDGVITIEEGRGLDTTVKVVDGFQFDKGYISPYFVTDPKEMTCELENPLVLLCEKKIGALRDFLPVLEEAARSGRPLFVVAEDIEGDALAALVVNRLRGVLKVCAAKAPGFGDRRKALLEDMAVLTGGVVVAEDTGMKLENVRAHMLGACKKVIVEKGFSTIVEGQGDPKAIRQRQQQVDELIRQSTSDYDKDKLKERLAKLRGGVAQIEAGGATEYDMKERKARVDDAVNAARAALAEGVVPGGGVVYLTAIGAVDNLDLAGDERVGAAIVKAALEAPIRQIAANAGFDGAVAAAEAREQGGQRGLDARTGQWVDMWEAGIIDPTKVARTALEKAASIASLMLAADTLVTDLKDKDKLAAGAVG